MTNDSLSFFEQITRKNLQKHLETRCTSFRLSPSNNSYIKNRNHTESFSLKNARIALTSRQAEN